MNKESLHQRLRLLAITNRNICGNNLVDATRELIEGGVTAVMLREKDLTQRELYDVAVVLAELCRAKDVLFLVNNSLEVALATKADGVHLGFDAIPPEKARVLAPSPFLVGFSAHNRHEVAQAESWGINYCTLSPIFYPTSKEISVPPIGLEGMRECADISSLPLVALGGITADNAGDCLAAGAAGIAAIGTLYGAPDRKRAAESFCTPIK